MKPDVLDLALLARWPMPSDADGDKFSRGTVLVAGGSPHTPSAAILAGTAALRMGAGRLQIATDAAVTTATAVAVPEALVCDLEALDELRPRIEGASCVLVGPGLIDVDLAVATLGSVLALAAPDAVVVIDANALDVIADIDRGLLAARAGRLVVTPNRQELAGLAEAFAVEANTDDADLAATVASAIGAVVTCFDDVAAPDGRRWRSESGHPSLGTSGSGDVLAGLVAGASARCGDAAQAACWGTLAHQLAGRQLGERCGHAGFLARELIDAVVPALSPIAAVAQVGSAG